MRNSGAEHSNPGIPERRIDLDRLATWKEIECAMSFTPCGAVDLRCTPDGYCVMESDFYGWVRVKNEDLARWTSRGDIVTTGQN